MTDRPDALERLLQRLLRPIVDRFIHAKLMAIAEKLEELAYNAPTTTERQQGIQAQAWHTARDLRKEAEYHHAT